MYVVFTVNQHLMKVNPFLVTIIILAYFLFELLDGEYATR